MWRLFDLKNLRFYWKTYDNSSGLWTRSNLDLLTLVVGLQTNKRIRVIFQVGQMHIFNSIFRSSITTNFYRCNEVFIHRHYSSALGNMLSANAMRACLIYTLARTDQLTPAAPSSGKILSRSNFWCVWPAWVLTQRSLSRLRLWLSFDKYVTQTQL
jgi:hypothetical protein